MDTPSLIGQSLARFDGADKVVGAAIYSADVLRPGCLWGGFVRSIYPHARIVSIKTDEAAALPGVRAIVTSADLPDRLIGHHTLKDKPPLARGVVRYVGERVVGVAAVDKDALEEAFRLITIDYEELPAIFDVDGALAPDAPVLHPGYSEYRSSFDREDAGDANFETVVNSSPDSVLPFMPGTVYGPRNMGPAVKNVQSIWRIDKGDVDAGFEEADLIFENTYTTPMIFQAYLEPGATVVEIGDSGAVDVWTSHQSRFRVQRDLAEFTGVPVEQISVNTTHVGGSFGGKMVFEDVVCAYYLARAAGTPVRVVSSYSEAMVDGAPRHAATVVERVGVKRDGTLWAWHGKVYYNGGAYTARTPLNSNMNGTLRIAGSYRTPNVRIESFVVYTNQVPGGYYRSPGEIQCLTAAENMADEIARTLDLDPLEFRLRNVVRDGDMLPSNQDLEDPRAVDVLRGLREHSGWGTSAPVPPSDAPELSVGRGVACGHRHIGAGETHMRLRLEPDGSFLLTTAVADTGTGAHTMHRQVVSEILGVDPALVKVRVSGTDGPFDEGIRASRGAHVEGNAAATTADEFIKLALSEAARYWEIPEDRIEWRAGRLFARESESELALSELAESRAGEPLEAEGRFRGPISNVYDFQAMVADVAVDRETGEVRVLHLYYTHDSTTIINPTLHDGQLYGAISQGLGHTLMEELVVDHGVIVDPQLADYKIPNIRDIPPLTLNHVPAAVGPGVFNAKGVSELGIGVVAPAIINAVCDAVGVRIRSLPLTSEKVHRALGSAE